MDFENLSNVESVNNANAGANPLSRMPSFEEHMATDFPQDNTGSALISAPLPPEASNDNNDSGIDWDSLADIPVIVAEDGNNEIDWNSLADVPGIAAEEDNEIDWDSLADVPETVGEKDKNGIGMDSLSDLPNFEEHMATDFRAPSHGGELVPTDQPNIMASEYDNMRYMTTRQGEIIPLKSPTDGSELIPTEQPNIMNSEYNDLSYFVSNQGKIVPLKNPNNGGKLDVIGDNHFRDDVTNQEFYIDENGEFVLIPN